MASTPAVTVQELQEILKTTKSPRKLIDPVTELPLWDEKLMTIVRNAKSYQEIKPVDEELRKTMEPQVDEVYPNIFIGNYKGAKTISLLKELGITHVLNVAEGTGFGSCGVFDKKPYEDVGIKYDGFVIRDNVDAKDEGLQETLFNKAADLIEKCLDNETCKVLVFCFGGFSRSTSSVLAYLFLKEKLDIREALKLVKSKRDVLPSAQQLVHLAKMFNKDRKLETFQEDHHELKVADYRMLSRQQQ